MKLQLNMQFRVYFDTLSDLNPIINRMVGSTTGYVKQTVKCTQNRLKK